MPCDIESDPRVPRAGTGVGKSEEIWGHRGIGSGMSIELLGRPILFWTVASSPEW